MKRIKPFIIIYNLKSNLAPLFGISFQSQRKLLNQIILLINNITRWRLSNCLTQIDFNYCFFPCVLSISLKLRKASSNEFAVPCRDRRNAGTCWNEISANSRENAPQELFKRLRRQKIRRLENHESGRNCPPRFCSSKKNPR